MTGRLSFEKTGDGSVCILFAVGGREDVNELTLKMMEMGFDVLYEPANRLGRYESCVLCSESTGMKIVACQEGAEPEISRIMP